MKELDFRLVLNRVLQGWKTPTAFAALAILLTIALLPFARPVYSMRMTVVPAPDDQTGGATGASGGAGAALTSILGVGSGATGGNYVRYQKLLVSPIVAQRMDEKYGALRDVFGANWNASENRWVAPSSLRSMLTGWLLRIAHVPTWSTPDATTLATYLDGKLEIVPSTQTDIVSVTMNDGDIAFARRIMLEAHEQANAVLRDQVARRARQQVAYLQQKLAETSVSDYRATLLAILSSQEKTLMLTQTDASFAAEILSPPMASPTPVAPRPVLSVFVASIVGGLIGTAIVILFGPEWWQDVLARIRTLPFIWPASRRTAR